MPRWDINQINWKFNGYLTYLSAGERLKEELW